jgi:hypothetical protein
MNRTTLDSVRFWAPTTLVGLVSTAGVSVLLTAVISAPAHSRPAPDESARAATPVAYCFMGRPNWPSDMVLPRCRR